MSNLKPNLYSDILLFQQVKEGSKQAFNVLVEKYWEKAYLGIYKRIKEYDAAKDIMQEIFTHIWIKRETLSLPNLPAYLHIAVRNKVIKFVAFLNIKHNPSRAFVVHTDKLGTIILGHCI